MPGRALLPLIALVLGLASCIWSRGALADLSEDQAKSSLIYNLTKFTLWPRTPADGTLSICVYRDDPLTPTLLTLREKTSKGLILRIQVAETTDEARECQVLFVGRGEQAGLRALIRALRGQPVLIVSDIPDSAASGATVEVVLENRRLAFKINKSTADEANLKLSAQLLSLAKVMYDGK